MKIRTAIFAVYVAACAVGYLVLMRFMLAEVRPRYVTALALNLQSSARLLAATIEPRDDFAALMSKLGGSESGLRVRLIGDDGTVLMDTSDPSEAEAAVYAEGSGRGALKQAATELLDYRSGGEGEITGSARWMSPDDRGATLTLSRPIRGVNAVVWAERKKLAAIALLIAGIMVAAGWWIAVRLTRSIERLTAYAQAVRDGRAAVPPESRAQEITTLTTAFEEMRDSLEGRQHVERYTQALAHEVKAPLSAIRGAAELLDEQMDLEQRRKFLANIRNESARIERIIERLLELTSVESRKVLRSPERIGAAQLLSDAADSMKSAYAARGVALVVEEGGEFALRGERFLLRQALLNLLQNALDFSPPGKQVRLRAAKAEARAVFSVEDEGPGVPDYAVERVFERFYSLPRPDTARKSTGIGLALVREVANLHGGGATLQNRASGGCSASLWVPLESHI